MEAVHDDRPKLETETKVSHCYWIFDYGTYHSARNLIACKMSTTRIALYTQQLDVGLISIVNRRRTAVRGDCEINLCWKTKVSFLLITCHIQTTSKHRVKILTRGSDALKWIDIIIRIAHRHTWIIHTNVA